IGRDAPEVKPLAAAQDRGGNLVRFSGSKDKAGVGRRLFQRLEQRVKGADAEHMNFVDDVDLVLAFAGPKANLFAQFAHVVHTVVAGRVDLDQVDHAPFVDGNTGGAL